MPPGYACPGGSQPVPSGWLRLRSPVTVRALPSSRTWATSAGSSVIGTCPQPGSRTNRAWGSRCRATAAWPGGSSRSRVPQAIVIGTSYGMGSVNDGGTLMIMLIASRAARKAMASA